MTQRRFEVQGMATWNGDPAVRPRGSTGKVREIKRHKLFVSWGYKMDVPRDEQPDAERWERRADLLPGFVPEEELVGAA